MTLITRPALKALVPSLATCGGDVGPMFAVALALNNQEPGILDNMVPKELLPVAEQSIQKLQEQSIKGVITARSVLHRYGLPDHYRDMNEEVQLGVLSVAREIDPEIRAVAHTLLPIVNGIYSNEGRIISFKGLVPLGPQVGNLVVHLGGVFSSGCTRAEIEAILWEQAQNTEFLRAADKVGELNYEGTQLQRATKRAKEALGL